MKKTCFRSLLLTGLLLLVLSFPASVFADQTEPINVGWNVNYTTGGKLDDSSFNAAEVDRQLSAMQPGDRIIFTIRLNNQKKVETRWYMENEVMKSMERLATDTGAYTYKLTYNGNMITSSEEFGGATDAGNSVNGMSPATSGLENYFEIGTIAGGGSGTVALEIGLEGESQGNSYQNAEARIRFRFAVNETGTTGGTNNANRVNVVKTGDESRNILYLSLMAAAGVILLCLAVAVIKRRKTETAELNDTKKGGR
ncbi:MAG: hypothetical protein IKE31_00775 [Eubacterium sp.]|nr:hypothetical protein [Eubacterium sp.]